MESCICRVISVFVFFLLELHINEAVKFGHYRCSWHFGSPPASLKTDTTTAVSSTDKPTCTSLDSSRITEYVNHCSTQNYVPLLACRDDGTWNCQSFIGMCKTLIHTESAAASSRAQSTFIDGQKQESKPSKDYTPTADDSDGKMFSPDENYFTMKEMAVAVLVSFITGATMLAIVICVVWRCRHSHLSSEQAMEAAHRSAKRLAALHAITHIAHAIGGSQDTMQSAQFTNPQYGQIIASRSILDDALMEHDRVYEEILTRRKSSCKSQDRIYANVDKPKKKNSTIRKNRSSGDLRTIDESAEESDFGYEADNNATPQIPRRKAQNLENMNNNSQRSQQLQTRPQNENVMWNNSVSYMNRLNSGTGKESLGKPPTDNQIEDEMGDAIHKGETKKCDSGYMEEIDDSHEMMESGEDKCVDKGDWDQENNGAEKRKNSLRL